MDFSQSWQKEMMAHTGKPSHQRGTADSRWHRRQGRNGVGEIAGDLAQQTVR